MLVMNKLKIILIQPMQPNIFFIMLMFSKNERFCLHKLLNKYWDIPTKFFLGFFLKHENIDYWIQKHSPL